MPTAMHNLRVSAGLSVTQRAVSPALCFQSYAPLLGQSQLNSLTPVYSQPPALAYAGIIHKNETQVWISG